MLFFNFFNKKIKLDPTQILIRLIGLQVKNI